ncbi:PQ-loop-domain-containing protein [Fomitopsis serialis]|uniref:PQ-loop-domain-containing protein n=1 Tax=Fomitopsis serialis TaxID=139415 RepID=UPI0020088040|nr:PQ-loop-domain-containing protein [Neoantrodia serialis]KAH9936153.1 PQ-loop-domain-containing protein [Neoantrodia serialis]
MDADGNGTLSNVLGWVSIACWLVVYTPQIYENYRLKSGEGLSVFFVVTWLIGDLCSLSGALLANLLPTIIILATYYSVCDSMLLFQIYYYRWTNNTPSREPALASAESAAQDLERTPLLTHNGNAAEASVKPSIIRNFTKYAGALCFVFVVGIAAWAVDEHIHQDQASPNRDEVVEWRSQVLGWISAAMFLGARVPQIVKNFQTRCEGLSPFLFVYSITGNTTFVLAILAASMDLQHLITNASWIAGSALTVFLDVFVLSQFVYYRSMDSRQPHVEVS